jgi:xylulose-5-phosphate/fructose-6-phosphate phosphoketolase
VVPIVHVNGFRMGAASLLGAMEDTQLGAYLAGMGWDSRVVTVRVGLPGEHRAFQEALQDAIEKSTGGTRTAVVLRCVKGWGGPASVAGRPVLGTADAHKTPMLGARRDATERRQLEEWLASYRPAELFDHRGHPTGELAEALRLVARPAAAPGRPAPRPGTAPVAVEPGSRFGPAVTATLRAHAAAGDLRVFSPDELSSNRLGTLAGEPWVAEVLAEEVLLAWLAGWTASGRRGVLISYEAFSPLLTAGIIAHLKHRRLAGPAPSLNLLLTSYGWHNVYSHADPSLATALLAAGDPAVRVLTPADPQRTAVALDEALGSTGRFNVIIAGKHVDVHHPQRTIAEEQNEGMAVWQHLSDATDAPDLTLVVAGDLPAQAAEGALPAIRRRLGCRVRVVCVLDLTVLGDPALWPRGLSDAALDSALGGNAAVLVVTLGHPAAIWGLLAGRLRRRHVDVIGWREPAHPMLQNELVQFAGLDPAGLCAAAERVVAAARGSAG